MTRLTINSEIGQLVAGIQDSAVREKILARKWISHSDVITLYRSSSGPVRESGLLGLLRGCEIYTEPLPPVEEQSESFKRQLEYLRNKLEEEEYQGLIQSSSIPTYDSLAESPSKVAKELKHQLTTIVNIIISVCSVAYAIWYWSGTSTHFNNAYRVLLSLFFSILVLVAEVVVFNGYLTKIDDAKDREKKKREVKKVIDSVVYDSKRKSE